MFRTVYADLVSWSVRQDRKPLILRGARQVGKSYLAREFGKQRFGRVVELNLERDRTLLDCFADNNPTVTIKRIEGRTNQRLLPDDSQLLFLDEVQATPEILAKLRWFAEEMPELPIIAAGSLLDFALAEHDFSMPVGRVSYLHMEPLGFEEFLAALGQVSLLATLRELVSAATIQEGSAIDAGAHAQLLRHFRDYLLVGGMPAAVNRFVEQGSLVTVSEVHQDLLASLRDDFNKYASRVQYPRLMAVMASATRQLGGKFRYSAADPHQKAATLKEAVDLLCLARVCHRVHASPGVAVPLGAGIDTKIYKLILLDTGLSSAMLGLSLHELERSDLVLAHRGALAEQFVGQALRLIGPAYQDPALYYWRRDKLGSEAEVDYLLQFGSRIIPIEVKAGRAGTLKSLHVLMGERGWQTAVRLNADLPSITRVQVDTSTGGNADYSLLSLPLYLVEQLPRLLTSLAERRK